MREIRISRARVDRIAAEVCTEYQAFVDRVNRTTDREINTSEAERRATLRALEAKAEGE